MLYIITSNKMLKIKSLVIHTFFRYAYIPSPLLKFLCVSFFLQLLLSGTNLTLATSNATSELAPISDSIEIITINRIIIAGNKKTKPHILTRELTFKEGDSVLSYVFFDAVKNSKNNLMNIGLFNFVDITPFETSPNHYDVVINVTERWDLFPFPVFELADRNFNEWLSYKDFTRVSLGVNIKQENFRGRDEIVQLNVVGGYTQKLGVYYTIPYFNKKQNLGLTFAFYSTRNHEIAYNSINNKLVFFKDENEFVRREYTAYFRLTKRRAMYNFFNTTFEFRKSEISDTIVSLNPKYFVNNSNQQNYAALTWSYRYDRRDYQPFPSNGYMFEFETTKIGFGIAKNSPNLIFVSAGIRKFQQVTPRINLSGAIKLRVTQKPDAPYYNQKALGYQGDYIRGYDYYVLNGQNFALFRSSVRFTILKTKEYVLPYIRSEKFNRVPVSIHLVGFFDAGKVTDNVFGDQNPLSNTWQTSYGGGISYVTYYDLVFRLEYCWNKVGESGFFFRIGSAF